MVQSTAYFIKYMCSNISEIKKWIQYNDIIKMPYYTQHKSRCHTDNGFKLRCYDFLCLYISIYETATVTIDMIKSRVFVMSLLINSIAVFTLSIQ